MKKNNNSSTLFEELPRAKLTNNESTIQRKNKMTYADMNIIASEMNNIANASQETFEPELDYDTAEYNRLTKGIRNYSNASEFCSVDTSTTQKLIKLNTQIPFTPLTKYINGYRVSFISPISLLEGSQIILDGLETKNIFTNLQGQKIKSGDINKNDFVSLIYLSSLDGFVLVKYGASSGDGSIGSKNIGEIFTVLANDSYSIAGCSVCDGSIIQAKYYTQLKKKLQYTNTNKFIKNNQYLLNKADIYGTPNISYNDKTNKIVLNNLNTTNYFNLNIEEDKRFDVYNMGDNVFEVETMITPNTYTSTTGIDLVSIASSADKTTTNYTNTIWVNMTSRTDTTTQTVNYSLNLVIRTPTEYMLVNTYIIQDTTKDLKIKLIIKKDPDNSSNTLITLEVEGNKTNYSFNSSLITFYNNYNYIYNVSNIKQNGLANYNAEYTNWIEGETDLLTLFKVKVNNQEYSSIKCKIFETYDSLIPTCNKYYYDYNVSTNNACGYFVYDKVADTIQIPNMKDGWWLRNSTSNYGEIQTDELPDIYGTIANDIDSSQFSGAFRYSRPAANGDMASGGSILEFRASNYNPIYKDNGVVQPFSLKVKAFVVLGTNKEEDITDDILLTKMNVNGDNIASTFADRLINQVLHKEVRYITKVHKDEKGFYYIYNDGWCIQGGRLAYEQKHEYSIINFFLPFEEKPFVLTNLGTTSTLTATETAPSVIELTTTGFKHMTLTNCYLNSSWIAMGFVNIQNLTIDDTDIITTDKLQEQINKLQEQLNKLINNNIDNTDNNISTQSIEEQPILRTVANDISSTQTENDVENQNTEQEIEQNEIQTETNNVNNVETNENTQQTTENSYNFDKVKDIAYSVFKSSISLLKIIAIKVYGISKSSLDLVVGEMDKNINILHDGIDGLYDIYSNYKTKEERFKIIEEEYSNSLEKIYNLIKENQKDIKDNELKELFNKLEINLKLFNEINLKFEEINTNSNLSKNVEEQVLINALIENINNYIDIKDKIYGKLEETSEELTKLHLEAELKDFERYDFINDTTEYLKNNIGNLLNNDLTNKLLFNESLYLPPFVKNIGNKVKDTLYNLYINMFSYLNDNKKEAKLNFIHLINFINLLNDNVVDTENKDLEEIMDFIKNKLENETPSLTDFYSKKYDMDKKIYNYIHNIATLTISGYFSILYDDKELLDNLKFTINRSKRLATKNIKTVLNIDNEELKNILIDNQKTFSAFQVLEENKILKESVDLEIKIDEKYKVVGKDFRLYVDYLEALLIDLIK